MNRPEIDRLLRSRAATQADLGRALGLPGSAVSNLLSGKRAIKDIELPTFARFLGVDLAEALQLLGVG